MKTFNYIVLFFVLSCYWAGAQSTNKQKLMDMEIYPYECIISEINYLKESWINCKTISLEDINNDFSNIQDLHWLRDVSKEKKAVFIGENHFYKCTQNLRNRILFALNMFN